MPGGIPATTKTMKEMVDHRQLGTRPRKIPPWAETGIRSCRPRTAPTCWSGLSRREFSQGTELRSEHPEWLLRTEGRMTNSLLNLGNPECRQWLTDHVCRLIQDNGIKIYRQDHNFAPLEHWRKNEAQDRQGMNENLHVQGYLQFWDDLLARNPGLWIDSCASGGRRNDLETMRRSVPLHYTDYGYGIIR